jgi:hypothetical protein
MVQKNKTQERNEVWTRLEHGLPVPQTTTLPKCCGRHEAARFTSSYQVMGKKLENKIVCYKEQLAIKSAESPLPYCKIGAKSEGFNRRGSLASEERYRLNFRLCVSLPCRRSCRPSSALHINSVLVTTGPPNFWVLTSYI